MKPHPLFAGFIKAARDKNGKWEAVDFYYSQITKATNMRNTLLIIALIAIAANCTPQNSAVSNSLPNVNIPLDEMNQKIILHETPGMLEAYKITDILFIDLENLSNSPVILPPDYGVKMFIKQDDIWLPITNKFSYSNSQLTLPTKKQHPSGIPVSVWPIVPEQSAPMVLRIVVIGQFIDNGESVGAYLDIVLDSNDK